MLDPGERGERHTYTSVFKSNLFIETNLQTHPYPTITLRELIRMQAAVGGVRMKHPLPFEFLPSKYWNLMLKRKE